MIRRVIMFTFAITTLAVAMCFLSYVWQFGYVGALGSIGLRQGKLWYVRRTVPIADAPGFCSDDASAVNRIMYSVGNGARFGDELLWPWVLGVPAAIGYVLILVAIRRFRKRPTPRWLAGSLVGASALIVSLWIGSQFLTVEFNGSHAFFRICDGAVSLSIIQEATNWGIQVQPGWSIHRGWPSLSVDGGRYLQVSGGWIVLGLPLGIATVVFVPPTILFARRQVPHGHCRRCSYDLTGNITGVCPECGTQVPPGNGPEMGTQPVV